MLSVFHIPGVWSTAEPGHLGDPAVAHGVLFVPMEDGGAHRMLQVDTSSFPMQILEKTPFDVSSPYVAYNPVNDRLYVSDFDGVTALQAYQPVCPRPHAPCTFVRDAAADFSLKQSSDGTPYLLDGVQGGTFSQEGHLYLVNSPQEFKGRGSDGLYIFRQDGVIADGSRSFIAPDMHIGQGPVDAYGPFEVEGVTLWDLDDGRAPGIKGQIHVLAAAPLRKAYDLHSDSVAITHLRVPAMDKPRL
jgi:hypothetical protein